MEGALARLAGFIGAAGLAARATVINVFLSIYAASAARELPGAAGRARVARGAVFSGIGRDRQGKVDTDVIKPSSKAEFTSIAIFVEKEEIALYDIEIEFGNGEKFSPATRLLFKEGSRSRVIDLPGKERVIKKITFKYGNLDAKKHARVEVWAKKA
jgi:hypothetical protein